MKRLIFTALAMTGLLITGSTIHSQELVPTPDPVGGHADKAAAPSSPPASSPDAWRYRWFDGRWWYWTSENRWMWYNDDEEWVPYDTTQGPSPTAQNQMPPPPHGGEIYPAPGYLYAPYYRGYYAPGVVVGAGPYGYGPVDVGVGRRVGVNVWGPHGAVRVGRIRVGW
jgi:hypothetical protein